jgi:hypothetical protein
MRTSVPSILLFTAVAIFLLAGTVSADTIIAVAPPTDNESFFLGNYSAWCCEMGETFLAPTGADHTLESVTYYSAESFPMSYSLDIFNVNGTSLQGAPIASVPGTIPNVGYSVGDPVPVTVDMGGITLNAGGDYAFVLMTSLSNTIGGIYMAAWVNGSQYADGVALLANSNTTVTPVSYADLAFSLDFDSGPTGASVPEPATLMLFGAGLVGVARRLRRRSATGVV